MELLNHQIEGQVIEHTYAIQHPNEGVLYYKEWIQADNGKFIDCILRSKSGYEIDDPALMEEVQEFIDNLG
jgi:hypothetical protein